MSKDLMYQDEIREVVRSAYQQIPTGAGHPMAEQLYSADELAQVPDIAVDWSLGVGNPVRHAGLSEGEVVLDLGCGGGIDSVLAARQVGPTGRVVGLDQLAEMRDRAEKAAEEAATSAWCEFMQGAMEDVPLPDASVDVIISNGVLNLSPRKSRAIAESFRVLRPGGRMCIADLTVDDRLPDEVLTSDAAWAGCISGALSEEVLRQKLEQGGFVDVSTSEPAPFSIDDVALYPLFSDEVVQLMRETVAANLRERVAVGLIVQAARPGPGGAMS